MKKKKINKPGLINKRASFDYDLSEKTIAGIVLSGPETKSLRLGQASLKGSFVTVKNGELWLNNLQINPLKTNAPGLLEKDRSRARKLLVTKRQLSDFNDAKNKGMSIIPIKILSGTRYIKIELGVGRGRKKYDKREVIKKRDQQRSLQRGEL